MTTSLTKVRWWKIHAWTSRKEKFSIKHYTRSLSGTQSEWTRKSNKAFRFSLFVLRLLCSCTRSCGPRCLYMLIKLTVNFKRKRKTTSCKIQVRPLKSSHFTAADSTVSSSQKRWKKCEQLSSSVLGSVPEISVKNNKNNKQQMYSLLTERVLFIPFGCKNPNESLIHTINHNFSRKYIRNQQSGTLLYSGISRGGYIYKRSRVKNHHNNITQVTKSTGSTKLERKSKRGVIPKTDQQQVLPLCEQSFTKTFQLSNKGLYKLQGRQTNYHVPSYRRSSKNIATTAYLKQNKINRHSRRKMILYCMICKRC